MVPMTNKSPETKEPEPVPQPEHRPRSGYARLRQRHHALIVDFQRLGVAYAELERAFLEMKSLNDILASDLMSLRRHSTPLPPSLMGAHHGR
jgi:hypothetical protein